MEGLLLFILLIVVIGILFTIKRHRLYDGSNKIKAKLVLNSISDPVMFFNSQYKLTKINQATSKLLGYNLKQLYLQELSYILPTCQDNKEDIEHIFKNKDNKKGKINLLTADGEIINAVYSAVFVNNEYNEFLGYIITLKDITDKKAIQKKMIESNRQYKKLVKKLSYAVKYDSLTGVFNRDVFYHKMQRLIHNYYKFQYDFAIVFADLNGFKLVNDQYGHDIGNKVIIEAANRLQRCVGKDGMVFRMGGDEFMIVLTKTPLIDLMMQKIRDIRKAFSDKIIIDKLEKTISIALGYAIFSESNEDLDTMLHRADASMYQDKIRCKKYQGNIVDERG